MATEVGTMSALVDDVIARSGRSDRKADIISWARSSMRELEVSAFYVSSFVESQVLATADPYIWTRPEWFRQWRIIEYPGIVDGQGNTIKPRLQQPSRRLHQGSARFRHYYYGAQNYFVMVGHGGAANTPSPINLGYFEYVSPLQYYANVGDRPARFILETNQWEYHSDYDEDDETRETARELVSNWLLFRWYDAVSVGTLNKVFATYEDPRYRQTYSAFQSQKSDLRMGEASITLGGETGD